MSITAPSTIRAYQSIPPINRAANDYNCVNGVRISTPCYVEIPNTIKKQIFNELRTLASQPKAVAQQPNSISGIQVVESSTMQPEIEAYLGCTLDTLRSGVLWQRGGLEISLVLKLQVLTGIELFSMKDITAAFKGRQDLIKKFAETYPFPASNS